jgi:hypothetical protein
MLVAFDWFTGFLGYRNLNWAGVELPLVLLSALGVNDLLPVLAVPLSGLLPLPLLVCTILVVLVPLD